MHEQLALSQVGALDEHAYLLQIHEQVDAFQVGLEAGHMVGLMQRHEQVDSFQVGLLAGHFFYTQMH